MKTGHESFRPDYEKSVLDMLAQKREAYNQAIQKGDIQTAQRIDQEAKNLMTELRMVNPAAGTTSFEQKLKEIAEDMTIEHHRDLYNKPDA